MRIYAVNLAPDVTENELRKEFGVFGQVSFVKITQEQVQDALVCSGLVGMPVRLEARAAITGLHGKVFRGNVITVNEVGTRSR